jgi:hypothetical protein
MAAVAPPLARPPSLLSAGWFAIRAWGHRGKRWLRDAFTGGPPRWLAADALRDAPVLAEAEGKLWFDAEDAAEHAWTAGKVENLRVARAAFADVEVAAGGTLGFWRQLGAPHRRRGFVVGRELRQGCVIPTVAGGLCQLSNLIYDCALRGGLEVVERHRHSLALPGSMAERDRDATVFWNYLDLRLRAPFAWRIEVELDAERIRVRIRGNRDDAAPALPLALGRATAQPENCATCDQHACHRHRPERSARGADTRAWLLDERWPEFVDYLAQARSADEPVPALPFRLRVHGSLAYRFESWRGKPLPVARAARIERVALAMARRLPLVCREVVVPQAWLPWLWRAGALGGRRFSVWMTALPVDALQARLEQARARHPDSPTLGDFRAPAWWREAEAAALAAADGWLSPHAEVLALAGERGQALPWHRPSPIAAEGTRRGVYFPGTALDRRGVRELREAWALQPFPLWVDRGQAEAFAGMAPVEVETMRQGLARAACVALPAWLEHQPRALLAALASGVPVVATRACGLPSDGTWREVEPGDAPALSSALAAVLEATQAAPPAHRGRG